MAFVICRVGVNGYTAITASALQLEITATSVENINDFILLPLIIIPLALRIHSGTIIV